MNLHTTLLQLCAEPPTAFDRVLVANRGEIAVRVMRTLRTLGIAPIAIHSDADADAAHVRAADLAVRVGPPSARHSYLDVDAVIAAALATGADAIHPGYGFLSENPEFAAACAAAGIVFIGPPVAAMTAMADKIAAKVTVAAAGVSVVPGTDRAGLGDAELIELVGDSIGFPALIKPSAGGGGKGMRLVANAAEFPAALASARREAASAFGDDTLLVERFITAPRHVEIQVLADSHGHIVHLGERECSLQRRHQKIIEEAPAAFLPEHVRRAMAEQAVAAARSCGYVNAGTVEFIVSADRPDEFFFMEMNTRLQVEHPVTEMVHDVDLVELQLRVAAGERLPFSQADLHPNGHAIEVRVYAEDADRGFLPTGGRIVGLREPVGPGIRVDSGVAAGSVVGSDYDPMLSKIIAWGDDRAEALHRLDHALADTAVLGVTTNIGFLRRLLADVDVRSGEIDTGLVERKLDELVGSEVPDVAVAGVALAPMAAAFGSHHPWHRLVGWRQGAAASTRHEFEVPGRGRVDVHTAPADGGWTVRIGDERVTTAQFAVEADGRWRVAVDGRVSHLTTRSVGRTTHVAVGGESWAITKVEQRGAGGDAGATHGDGTVRSPMPGTVIAVSVGVDDRVVAGQALAVVEAMKMEHTLTAPFDGVVTEVHVAPAGSVGLDQPIVTIAPSSSPDATD